MTITLWPRSINLVDSWYMWLSTPPGAGKKKSLTIAMLYDMLKGGNEMGDCPRCRPAGRRGEVRIRVVVS